MNIRTPLRLSAIVIAVMLAISIWGSLNLPANAAIPIHWNTAGQIDRVAHGIYALYVAPALVALIALVFWLIPKLEPRRLHLEASRKFYSAIWIGTVLLLAAIHGASTYAALHHNANIGSIAFAGVSLLMIVIGNYLGKTRSMFLAGVRTPWTLSSEYSWQRTHSLAGKLFVLSGAASFAAAIAAPPQTASRIFLFTLAGAIVVSVVASYFYWRHDPERCSEQAR